MAGIFTRPEVDKILNDGELTNEQKTERLFSLYGRSLDDGYISRSAAEEAKQAAVDAAKAQIPEPIDPKTTPEYQALARERDMLRTIGGEDFQNVKPKFREAVFDMLNRGEGAATVADQLAGIKEKYEEYFVPERAEETKNTPQFSQQPGHPGVNSDSAEDQIYKKLSAQW